MMETFILDFAVVIEIHFEIEFENPLVDFHWFFEISIRTEKKFQSELKKKSVSLY